MRKETKGKVKNGSCNCEEKQTAMPRVAGKRDGIWWNENETERDEVEMEMLKTEFHSNENE